MTNAVSISALTKSFGTLTAVDNLTFSIPRGQIVALLGHNGAGKTTLIDMILGLQTPTSGTVKLMGMPPQDAIADAKVGIVFQTGALLPDYTVSQILHLFASLYPHPRPLNEIYTETDLLPFAKTRIGKLSGGEQQRVRLALALLPDPEVLFLDEPTAGMDAMARRAFWELMRTQANRGRTIIFATHYLAEAEDFAQRTIIMKRGKVLVDAATSEIQRNAATSTLSIDLPGFSSLPGNEAFAAQSALESELSSRVPSGKASFTWEGQRLTMVANNTDAAAAFLLSQPDAHNLTITPSTLEDAYAQLVSDEHDGDVTA